MSLIGQAILGGIGAAADTGAGLLVQNMKYNHEAEMEKARELRAMNLARFNQVAQDARDDKKYEQQNIREDSKAAKLQEAEERKLNDKYRVDGQPVTEGELRTIVKGNREAATTQAGVKSRENEAFNTIRDEGDLLRTSSIKDAREIGAPTGTEQGIIGKARRVTSNSEEAALAKAESEKAKYEFNASVNKQLAEMKIEAVKAQYEAKLLASQGNKGAEKDLKELEKKIKGMELMDKILTNKDGTPPTDDQLARAEVVAKEVGVSFSKPSVTSVEPSVGSIEQATKEINEKAGYFSSDSSDFAAFKGDRGLAIKARAKEIEAEKGQKPVGKSAIRPALTPEQARAALKARGKL